MSNPRKRYPKSYRLFLDQAIDITGYEEDYIAQLLKDRFGAFNPMDTTKYLNHVVSVKELESTKTDLDKEVAKRMKSIPCPICGAKTSNPKGRAGKYTKVPEWRCNKGGLTHFLWDKANHIVTLRNQRESDPNKHSPLPFPPEVLIDNDTGTDNGGDNKPGEEQPREDLGTDSRVEEVREGDTRGVQEFAPVRLPTSGSS